MTEYLQHLVTLWAIFAMGATVVATLAEDAGLVHVGAAGFMGIGAYTVALLTVDAGVNPQLALLATLPVGVVVGVAIHLSVARLRGDVLALATLAIGIILYGIMLSADSLTGGPMGLAGIPSRLPLTGYDSLDALFVLTLLLCAVAIFRGSQFGLRVRALREDEALAEDLELRSPQIRAFLWMASSAVLSFAGGLFAFHLRYIDPSSFTVRESVGILAMALLIPRLKYVNASIGALAFIAIPELLRFIGLPAAAGAEVRQLVFGAALLIVIARSRGAVSRAIVGRGAHA